MIKTDLFRDDYRNNSYNFEAKLMRLSDDIHNCLTEIVDVLQQFAEGYCFVTLTVERSKKSFRYQWDMKFN